MEGQRGDGQECRQKGRTLLEERGRVHPRTLPRQYLVFSDELSRTDQFH